MQAIDILLLDVNPETGLSGLLHDILVPVSGFEVRLQRPMACSAGSLAALQSHIKKNTGARSDVVFLILSQDLLKQANSIFQTLRESAWLCPVIMAVEACDSAGILDLLEWGAADFVTPPLKPCDVIPRLMRVIEQKRRSQSSEHRLKEKLGLNQLIGESGAFREAVAKIPLIAQCDASVLISGETGTGKELCARAIHYLSTRARHPFVSINCGAIPTQLMENELFGHQRGAFTDASSTQPGLIREADGGTLFLDEVDALPLQAQVKLLRFLQEKEYRPLGASKTCKADVRVIAASNTDFDQAVRSGSLRQDLYYRLNVIPLNIPPLRERQEDIPLLSHHFLARYTAEFGKPPRHFSQEALRRLELYPWPGNVRELEHLVARAVALSERNVIDGDDLGLPQSKAEPGRLSFREAKEKLIAQFEIQYIQELLAAHQGNISKAARAARKNRRVFWQLIRKHGIETQNFR